MPRFFGRHYREKIVQRPKQVFESRFLFIVTMLSRTVETPQEQFALSEHIVYGRV